MLNTASAVKEAMMQGSKESDYLLFVEDKAIAVAEVKKEENPLGDDVAIQAEHYAVTPQNWYGLWFNDQIPLVYLANGKKIYFKNMLVPDSELEAYVKIKNEYSHYIASRIIFFDIEQAKNPDQLAMKNKIVASKAALLSMINEQISNLG